MSGLSGRIFRNDKRGTEQVVSKLKVHYVVALKWVPDSLVAGFF